MPGEEQSDRALVAIEAAALVLLASLVFCLQRPLMEDEPWHLASLALIPRFGLGVEFLRALPGTPGPLYAVVHYALAPLTHVAVPGVRVVNVVGFSIVLVLLWRLLRHEDSESPVSSAGTLLACPVIWILAGLAFTEMPAMVCLLG